MLKKFHGKGGEGNLRKKNPLLIYIQVEWKHIHGDLHTTVFSSIIHNSQNLETT